MDDLGFEPTHFGEDGEPTLYRWNFDKFYESLSPIQQRNHDRRHKVNSIVFGMYRNIPWMDWPILKVVYTFWHNLFEEGIVSTCKPRWGVLTFSYLNDGIKPSLWHTWRQITRSRSDSFVGIYPEGAPKSFKQAEEQERKYNEMRRV